MYPPPPTTPTAVIVDYRISAAAVQTLDNLGIAVIKTFPCETLSPAVCGHPDMLICHLGGQDWICCPESYDYFCAQLGKYNLNLIKGSTGLNRNYPYDVAYNIAMIGNSVFCNKKTAGPEILAHYQRKGKNIIHVRQGYAKCNICIVGENAIITGDSGIAKAARNAGVDVLEIQNGHIALPPYEYGFFGGCCGLISKGVLAVNGRVGKHPDFQKINKFCEKYGVQILCLSDEPLTDIGSILPIFC